MLSGPITMLVARARQRDLQDHALRAQRAASRSRASTRSDETPVTRVTLRYACTADAERLQHLRELDSAPKPTGALPLGGESALVAEVDGRLRAALPLDGGAAVADPFYRGAELVDLLRLRAAQLAP
jgi:hypothetical protein